MQQRIILVRTEWTNDYTKRFQQMKKMNFLKIAWWFLPNIDAVNTIPREKMTYDQFFGPLPAPE